MTADADRFWNNIAGKLRKKKGFCPPTSEEAEVALNEATPEPQSDDRVKEIVDIATTEGEENWDEEFQGAEGRELQLHRKKGAEDSAAKKAEKELEDEMLNDDNIEKDET
jgi:hypothetical protein